MDNIAHKLRMVSAALPRAVGTTPPGVMVVVDNGAVTPWYEVCEAAAAEIERLRALAGAVSAGPTAAETLAPLRHKAPDGEAT